MSITRAQIARQLYANGGYSDFASPSSTTASQDFSTQAMSGGSNGSSYDTAGQQFTTAQIDSALRGSDLPDYGSNSNSYSPFNPYKSKRGLYDLASAYTTPIGGLAGFNLMDTLTLQRAGYDPKQVATWKNNEGQRLLSALKNFAKGGRVNYANGGRSRYGLGKLVKKITQPAKKLIKSDLGKAALTAAAIYTLGGGGNPFTAAGRGKFATMNIPGYLKAKNYLIGTSANTSYPGTRGLLNRLGITKLGGSLGLTGKGLAGLGILGASTLAGLSVADEEDDENLDEAIARVYGKSDLDIPGIRKAALGYSDPNELYFQLPSAFRSKVANGGIMTLTREEEEQKDINEDSLLNKAKAIAKKEGISVEEALKKIMEYNFEQDITYSGKAEGGLMNLGGNEMDLRGGGFVPIGAKEKADDVPARLSKNEFVFTADAVRAAGGGSIEKGAQKMYNTMKQLENII